MVFTPNNWIPLRHHLPELYDKHSTRQIFNGAGGERREVYTKKIYWAALAKYALRLLTKLYLGRQNLTDFTESFDRASRIDKMSIVLREGPLCSRSSGVRPQPFFFVLDDNFRIRILMRDWKALFFQQFDMFLHAPSGFKQTIFN